MKCFWMSFVVLVGGVVAVMPGIAADPSGPAKVPVFQMRAIEEAARPDTEEMLDPAGAGAVSTRMLHVNKKVLLDQTAVASAVVMPDQGGRSSIMVDFTREGGKRFAEVTRDLKDRRLAIVVQGQLLSAPVIREEITGGKAVISGRFSHEEAKEIAEAIRPAGARKQSAKEQ